MSETYTGFESTKTVRTPFQVRKKIRTWATMTTSLAANLREAEVKGYQFEQYPDVIYNMMWAMKKAGGLAEGADDIAGTAKMYWGNNPGLDEFTTKMHNLGSKYRRFSVALQRIYNSMPNASEVADFPWDKMAQIKKKIKNARVAAEGLTRRIGF